MKKQLLTFSMMLLVASACGDDDTTPIPADGSTPGTFQVTITNMSDGQIMTPPVIAIHDPSAKLFAVGETASDEVRDIAETGDNTALVASAEGNENVSAAGVAGDAPFGPGESVTAELTTTASDQVISVVNMVICTNDGIAGVDSVALPEGTEAANYNSVAYDAGTRVNVADAESFFPPPCKDIENTIEADLEDPRAPIALHPGQTGVINATEGNDWDFDQGAMAISIEVTRQ